MMSSGGDDRGKRVEGAKKRRKAEAPRSKRTRASPASAPDPAASGVGYRDGSSPRLSSPLPPEHPATTALSELFRRLEFLAQLVATHADLRAALGQIDRPLKFIAELDGVTLHALVGLETSHGLTSREYEITECLGRGEGDKGIGRRLGISDETVGKHISAGCRKTRSSSRTQLVRRTLFE